MTLATLDRVIDHCLDSGWPADLALVTGDLVQDDSRGAYENFCRLVARLGMPVYSLPGNHDVRALMREVLEARGIRYCETADKASWRIACIDSCETGVAAGRIAQEELARLRSLLGESPAEHILVALHHPPVPVGTAWLDEVGLQNPDAFLEVVSRDPRVRIVLFGHIHQAYDRRHDALRILGTPSTCRQFLAGSDSFAVDDRPPAYRRLTLYPDGTADTEVVWTG